MKAWTQEELDNLIACPKIVKKPPAKSLTDAEAYLRGEFEAHSAAGDMDFLIFMRRSKVFEEDFSIGLVYSPDDASAKITLFRCNGPHGTPEARTANPKVPHYDYHVHRASAKNIEEGLAAERNPVPAAEYANYEEALRYFLSATRIEGAENLLAEPPKGTNGLPLFEGKES